MARKKKIKIRPGCLVTPILLAVCVLVLFLTPIFSVKKIDVKGSSSVSSEVMINASGIALGTNIFRVNTKKVAENIRKQQLVEDVKVTRVLPSTIRISIKEGKVSAYVSYGANAVGISTEGKTLSLVDSAARSAGVPTIYGLSVEECTMGESISVTEPRKLENAIKLLNSFSNLGMIAYITAIDVGNSESIAFRYTDNLKVIFGSMDDYDYKMECLPDIIEELDESPYGLINMINPEQITYRSTIE